jgi:hypothetical protein
VKKNIAEARFRGIGGSMSLRYARYAAYVGLTDSAEARRATDSTYQNALD